MADRVPRTYELLTGFLIFMIGGLMIGGQSSLYVWLADRVPRTYDWTGFVVLLIGGQGSSYL